MSNSPDVRQVLTDILPLLDDRSVEALYLTATAMHALKKIEKETSPAAAPTLSLIGNSEA